MTGLPAIRLSLAVVVSTSGAEFAVAPGAPCGHRFNVTWPGAGCQMGLWANKVAERATMAAMASKRRGIINHRNREGRCATVEVRSLGTEYRAEDLGALLWLKREDPFAAPLAQPGGP